jgi:hypothetical protein
VACVARIEAVEAFRARLAAPLSEDEIEFGWTETARAGVLRGIEAVLVALRNDEPVPPVAISRALDHHGVVGGELLEEASRISNALREWNTRARQ